MLMSLVCSSLQCAFNPQGTKAITASSDQTCRMWDVSEEGSTCLQVFEGHTDEIFSCAYNYEGDTIITGVYYFIVALGVRGLAPCLPRMCEFSRQASVQVCSLWAISHGISIYLLLVPPVWCHPGSKDNTCRIWKC